MSSLPALQRIERLAGAVEDHELDRHAEPLAEFAGQFDGDAERLAVRALLRQHAVALVDRGAKLAGGGEFFNDLGRNSAHGDAFPDGDRSDGEGSSILAVVGASRRAVCDRMAVMEKRSLIRVAALLLGLPLAACQTTDEPSPPAGTACLAVFIAAAPTAAARRLLRRPQVRPPSARPDPAAAPRGGATTAAARPRAGEARPRPIR